MFSYINTPGFTGFVIFLVWMFEGVKIVLLNAGQDKLKPHQQMGLGLVSCDLSKCNAGLLI